LAVEGATKTTELISGVGKLRFLWDVGLAIFVAHPF
tara:strand:- start:807 stop:914 length:108 start_codon:yes stop_codon:yes gene_type:complete